MMFPNEMNLLRVWLEIQGGELYHHFCLQLGSVLMEHHLSFPSNFQVRKFRGFFFLSFLTLSA